MSAASVERTLLPPDDERQLRPLLKLVESQGTSVPQLTGPDGTSIALPDQVYEVLRVVVAVMSAGKAVTVAPHNLQLTTQEAAEMLGISRPTLVSLLERGEIPFTQPNRHRRIALTDLLDYQQAAQQSRQSALREIAEISDDLGLYEGDDEPLRR